MSQIDGADLINELEAKSTKYMCLADVLLLFSQKLNCDVGVAAEVLLSRMPLEQDINPPYFGQKIGIATFKRSDGLPLLSSLLEDIIIGKSDVFEDNPFGESLLSEKYWEYSFIIEGLEQAISFKLDTLSQELPDYLKPYKTRVGIQLTEVANIMAGCKPREVINRLPEAEIIGGFMASLWDAVDHNVLSGTNEVVDYGYNEAHRADITLLKDEVTEWAKKHDIKWPFDVPNKEIELADSFEQTIQTLKTEKEELEKELQQLRSSSPILLGHHRTDDPLAIAIELRNSEWSSYNENVRSTIPSAEYLIAKIKSEHAMSDALAKAIEKVACPIQR
ncbi:hypothetical protein [Hafnia sp. HMSC23F03]|uniref:hypothetical protein n=1 Tax=Hafnia sp. HMSC23F03 TaxID=1581059 RepID=UPI0008A4131D|nr:hypothetical protein [Hafnia sp. HMSC23F03]OFS12441.1 hypothetical protein HMPREF3091_02195 [Hafnia sp. HMSC23F03]